MQKKKMKLSIHEVNSLTCDARIFVLLLAEAVESSKPCTSKSFKGFLQAYFGFNESMILWQLDAQFETYRAELTELRGILSHSRELVYQLMQKVHSNLFLAKVA